MCAGIEGAKDGKQAICSFVGDVKVSEEVEPLLALLWLEGIVKSIRICTTPQ